MRTLKQILSLSPKVKMNLLITYKIFAIPAFVFHELSHLIMIFILGVKATGMKIHISIKFSERFQFDGCVYNLETNKYKRFFISVAPFIFWLTGYLYFLINFHPMLIYFCLFTNEFLPSDGDINAIKSCFGKANDEKISYKEMNSQLEINKTSY